MFSILMQVFWVEESEEKRQKKIPAMEISNLASRVILDALS